MHFFFNVTPKFALLGATILIASCSTPIIVSPDAILPDGSQYEGDVLEGKFHGLGVIKYKDGSYYEGGFHEGLFHGQGKYVFSSGISYQGVFSEGKPRGEFEVVDKRLKTHYQGQLRNWDYHGQGRFKASDFEYEGAFANGLLHGEGTLKNSDGSIYTGDFVDGEFSGDGQFTYPNNVMYEGEFLKGSYHGEGKEISPEGWEYQRSFREGQYSGQGVYMTADGDFYKGAFLNGQYHGLGEVQTRDGATYKGMFAEGLYNGKGVYLLEQQRYDGDFVDGVFSGVGKYSDYNGNVYEGEVANWSANGQGTLTSKDGSVSTGQFENGMQSGLGKRVYPDGSVYEGNFAYGEADGRGQRTDKDGSIYSGEFSYGVFSGEGKLVTPTVEGGEKVTEGKWQRGKLVHNYTTGERMHTQAEVALDNHQSLLQASFSSVPAGTPNQSEMFFLGVAGDGRQSVFLREVEFVSNLIADRFNLGQRAIKLINHHDTADQYPLATRRSLAASLKTIADKMNKDDDVLFLYLTSHGSEDHELVMRHDSIRLPALSATELASQLDSTGIKWRVIVISACYSGGFIDPLRNEHTLVLTAASKDNRSFGCSEDSELTYFAKALFKEVLLKQPELSLEAAFDTAKQLVAKWEEADGYDLSDPQMHAPPLIVDKLESLQHE